MRGTQADDENTEVFDESESEAEGEDGDASS